jgi:hypothetical protein
MNAEQFEKAILREAEGGPTKVVDLPDYDAEDDRADTDLLSTEETIERFKKENPEAIVYDDFEDGSEVCARVPIEPCPAWSTLYLAVYELDQNYGGPEEGGWWYDSGEVVDTETVRVCFKEDRTPYLEEGERAFLCKLAEKWAIDYEFGTTHRTSTRPRGRDLQWHVEWGKPEDFPKHRPCYS